MPGIVIATVDSRPGTYGATTATLAAIAPNIYAGLLHAFSVAAGIPTVILDAAADNLDAPALVRHILQAEPELLCLIASGPNPSASTMTMPGIIAFCAQHRDELAERRIKIAIWGPHPTVLPERTLRETGADYVILGEGYAALVGLYRCLAGGCSPAAVPGLGCLTEGRYQHTAPPELMRVESLPPVDWRALSPAKYRAHNWHCLAAPDRRSPYAIVWTSMGCPHDCSFCSVNTLYGRRAYRLRAMPAVLEEIDLLVAVHGVRNIKIADELFVTPHPRIIEFCDALAARGYDLNLWCFSRLDTVTPELLQRLKRAGMNWIAYGFESTNRLALGAVGKSYPPGLAEKVIRWTREAGIHICADIIIGLWEDDREALQATREFIISNNFEWVNIYPAFAYPGTALYDEHIRRGTITPAVTWQQYALYGYETECLQTKYLTAAEVLEFRDRLFTEYYNRPAYRAAIARKFGEAAAAHIDGMCRVPLRRRLLADRP